MADVRLKSLTFPDLPNRYVIKDYDADIAQIFEDVYNLYPRKSLPSAPIHSFGDGADNIPVKSMEVAVRAVQSGSGDPSPDNVRPISGWSSASVVDNGINQWDEVWEQGNIGSNGQNSPSNTIGRSKNYIRVDASTTYYIKGTGIKPYFYDINKAYLSTTTSKTDTTITTPANTAYMRFTVQGTTYNHDISVNYPSTDATYAPYNGKIVTIAFGSTVYGGVLKYVSGKEWEFTATHAAVDLGSALTSVTRQANSDTNDSVSNFLCLFSYTGDAKYEGGFVNFVSNRFSLDTANFSASSGEGILWGMNQGRIYLRINRSRLSADTADGLTAWLTANQTNLVYELEQPVTVTLTADADTVTVYGDNVMFADCGDSTLTYRQDIGLVIGG